MRRIRLTAAVSMALLMTVGAVAPVAARPSAQDTVADGPVGATDTAGATSVGMPTTVRLITGDRVTLTTGPDGKRSASVQPGPGRDGILFRTAEQDGRLSVLPSDAADLVSAGTLDRELFDVTALVSQGYDEAHTDSLPLIVAQPSEAQASGAQSSETRAAETLRSLSGFQDDSVPSRRLESIGARSLRIPGGDLGTFWQTLAPAGDTMTARDLRATPKIWLDGKVNAVLDRSTAQINAPAAWDAGYRGQGVKVAVLDTGADTTHPDLTGRVVEAKDFSGSGGTEDVFGHGTHVASTVGGSGAASGGSRKGVAPQAGLLIGKVLGNDGYGTESQVIAGMEWAAAEGAKVVNMSLGSDTPTDGTDPMSRAVDELTASSGALFVVAAGNSGEMGDGTVGSPGAADTALTVGAVDRDDSLAPFSSRGPRLGDGAVKPDVTAPGVGIVAARATGTTMGDPVDPYYVAASGTSMATPHVTGAAALLAQQHPDWRADRLKDALVSTARTVPGQQPPQQGGGRIDLAAAALGPLTATGTVALGPFQTGTTAAKAQADGSATATVRTATVRYTNTSAAKLSLRLTSQLATTGGRALASGALRLGTDTVDIAPGATVEVPLSADPSRAERGDYYGYVTATSSDGRTAVHTTVSFVVNGPVHRLTVDTIDLDGKHIEALPTIWGPDGFVDYTSLSPAVAEVEEGTYQLSHASIGEAEDGQELRQVVLPEVKVTKDISVTLDERRTTPVEIRTPRPAEQRGIVSYQTYRQIDGHSLIQGVMYFDIAKRVYVSPTAPVTEGTFEFASRWQLVAPLIETEVSGTKTDLDPYYMPNSPLFSAKGVRLAAVDAGTATAPDLRPARVRGKLAVVRDDGGDQWDLAQAAAKAGAKGLLVIFPYAYPWTRWSPVGDRYAVPVIRISEAGGTALLAAAERHTTTVGISGTAESPYLYDVMQVSSGRIPQQVVHTVSDRNSAQVRTTYADNGGTSWASEQRFGWRPYQSTAWNQYTRHVPTGHERTEYISSGDTLWQHVVNHTTTFDVDAPLQSGMKDAPRTYRAGERTDERWFGAVVRPAVPEGAGLVSTRSGDVLALRIPEFTDSTAGHWSRTVTSGGGIGTSGVGTSGVGTKAEEPEGDTSSATLYRDGTKVSETEGAWGDIEVAPGKGDFRLDLSTSRVSDEWAFGTRTTTSWSFRSDTTTGRKPLPLLQLDYDVRADARNAVDGGRSHDIGLTVRAQDGLPAPGELTVRVDASYDDGRTWQQAARVGKRGQNGFTVTLDRPARQRGDAYVTLRVTATDRAGSSIRQTVERAYLVRG
ncbi:S8 family serine peptidase [Streptomyces sp. NPDC059479]|uniref:S8 family peptidase n=1 Tax=Streptomyces sp. NPDC059479 TaxID=3346848 RepID=UPI003698DB28